MPPREVSQIIHDRPGRHRGDLTLHRQCPSKFQFAYHSSKPPRRVPQRHNRPTLPLAQHCLITYTTRPSLPGRPLGKIRRQSRSVKTDHHPYRTTRAHQNVRATPMYAFIVHSRSANTNHRHCNTLKPMCERWCHLDGGASIIHSRQQTISANHPSIHPSTTHHCRRASANKHERRDAERDAQANRRPRDGSVSLTESLPRVSTCMFRVARTLRDTSRARQPKPGTPDIRGKRVDGMGGHAAWPWGRFGHLSSPSRVKHCVGWQILLVGNTDVRLPDNGCCVRLLEGK
jgi:hypothetical protein